MKKPVYLDNHATTRVDPRVIEAMLPFLSEHYGNAGSTSHVFGWQARDAVEEARSVLAQGIGAKPRELIFTSGATEANNLAIRGFADRHHAQGQHLVSVVTEHHAVLDPLDRLTRRGFAVDLAGVDAAQSAQPGTVRLDELEGLVRDDTILVSVMLANNEIGVIQPLTEISRICRERNVALHCDATQAVGRLPVDVDLLGVDLMSFSAHKMYGPKGVGALYVRRSSRNRLVPLIDGGGHERGMRSGTLNVPAIVGFARAMQLCQESMPDETARIADLRQRLFDGLKESVEDCGLNGPPLRSGGQPNPRRLTGNLNMVFRFVEGESLMMSMSDLAVSSGSACSSASPEPSHVLRALGLSDDEVRSSLRFGIGRFSTMDEIDFAVESLAEAVQRLRQLNRPA